jgi:hypothetical protein
MRSKMAWDTINYKFFLLKTNQSREKTVNQEIVFFLPVTQKNPGTQNPAGF